MQLEKIVEDLEFKMQNMEKELTLEKNKVGVWGLNNSNSSSSIGNSVINEKNQESLSQYSSINNGSK